MSRLERALRSGRPRWHNPADPGRFEDTFLGECGNWDAWVRILPGIPEIGSPELHYVYTIDPDGKVQSDLAGTLSNGSGSRRHPAHLRAAYRMYVEQGYDER